MNFAQAADANTAIDTFAYGGTNAYLSRHPLTPPAFLAVPKGCFRLFRIVSLYPVPTFQLQTFPYPEPCVGSDDPPNPSPYPQFTSYEGSYQGLVDTSTCPPYDVVSYTRNPLSDANSSGILNYAAHGQLDLSNPRLHPEHTAIPTQTIAIHTQPYSEPVTFQITAHLLYGLLTAQELCNPTWLFVDAICIDQTDPIDKATQVYDIDRVLGGARRVLVWLGMDLGLNSSAVENEGGDVEANVGPAGMAMGGCLERIPLLIQVLETHLNVYDRDQTRDNTKKEISKRREVTGLPSSESALWPSLQRLRTNPWFAQLCVTQEVILARDVILLYGRHWLPWTVYAQLTALCERAIATRPSNLLSDRNFVELMSRVSNKRVSALMNLKQVYRQAAFVSDPSQLNSLETPDYTRPYSMPTSTQQISTLLHHLIQHIRTADSYDPIDRVYAILGLLPPHIRSAVRIDYTSDALVQPGTVWVEFLQTALIYAPDLAEAIFSTSGRPNRQHSLPSWCPDLGDGGLDRTLRFGTTTAGMHSGKKWTEQESTPTNKDVGVNDAEAEFRFVDVIPGTMNIRVKGVAIDEVVAVIDLSWIANSLTWSKAIGDQTAETDTEVARDVLTSLWKCLEVMRDQGTSVQNGDAVLARCLVANAYEDQQLTLGKIRATKEVKPPQLVQDYIAFTHWMEWNTWRLMSGSSLKKATKSAALRYAARFRQVARNRACFVTARGRTGVCSSSAQKGDLLCLVVNMSVPYLLRKQDGGAESFEMIGETYVDGIMGGEGFSGKDLGKEKVEDFVIC